MLCAYRFALGCFMFVGDCNFAGFVFHVTYIVAVLALDLVFCRVYIVFEGCFCVLRFLWFT